MRQMRFLHTSTTLALVFILGTLSAFGRDPAPAKFSELVRNTKESESILLKGKDLSGNEAIRGPVLSAFDSVAEKFEPSYCEPKFLSRLESELTARGVPTKPGLMRSALLVLRESNRIDDLALMPLLAAEAAWSRVGYEETDWTRTDSEGRTIRLECPTDQYLSMVAILRSIHGRKTKRHHIRERIIEDATRTSEKPGVRPTPVQTRWLRALYFARFEKNTEFTLGSVLEKVELAKNTSARADREEPPTRFLSKRKKKSGGLSNRLSLYRSYDGLQIALLAKRFQSFTERMDISSSEAQIKIQYKDGRPDEIYNLNPQEQYRMAAKMLHKEVEELKLSGIFAGRSPTFEDVIVASVETGFIRAAELDAALGVDDLWNPKVSTGEKVLTIVRKYGTTALILIPNPYTFWASLAVILTEVVISNKTAGPGKADDHGTSIF